jgi:hypothetical protein
MVTFRRIPRSDGRVGFSFQDLDDSSRDRLIKETGLIARTEGERIGNPAQLYDVAFIKENGTQGSRVGGFSVPAEIADNVTASLITHGHSVE